MVQIQSIYGILLNFLVLDFDTENKILTHVNLVRKAVSQGFHYFFRLEVLSRM